MILRRKVLAGLVAAPFVAQAKAQTALLSGSPAPGQTLSVILQTGPHWASAPAPLQQAMTDFVAWLEANIFIPTTIAINVDYGFCNGQSVPNGSIGFTQTTGLQQDLAAGYSQVRAGIAANARSTVAQQVLADSFPSSDPTGGATMVVNNAHMRILGIWAAWPAHAPGGTGADSFHGFGSLAEGTDWFYGTPVAGKFDAYGTIAHEVSEGIFRQTTNFSPGSFCCPQNLVTYVSAGVVRTGLFSSSTSYFSTDGGVTNLRTYSQIGDQMDWDGAIVDSFNAVASSGQTEPVSTTDTQLFDVMGCSSVA